MNQANIMRLTGTAASGVAYVEWDIPSSGTTDEIAVIGGNYLLLCCIDLQLADLTSNLFYAEWSDAKLKPQRFEYHTREHSHYFTGHPVLPAGDLGNGPRLIYRNPLQWWSGGLLAEGTLKLQLSHAASVILIAVRVATISNAASLGADLI
jgi:hypothetical protein